MTRRTTAASTSILSAADRLPNTRTRGIQPLSATRAAVNLQFHSEPRCHSRICSKPTSASALRVRVQGIDCHAGDKTQRREFGLHTKALHGNPLDGHTLAPVTAEPEELL